MVEVTDMCVFYVAHLVFDCIHDMRMTVAARHHRNPCKSIQVSLTLVVEHVLLLSIHQVHWFFVIGFLCNEVLIADVYDVVAGGAGVRRRSVIKFGHFGNRWFGINITTEAPFLLQQSEKLRL